jgi:hypothetical protein
MTRIVPRPVARVLSSLLAVLAVLIAVPAQTSRSSVGSFRTLR